MKKKTPHSIHPGEQLQDELDELGLSGKEFSRLIDVPPNRVNDILRGRRGVTADTALRVSRYFGTTAQYWMNLQSAYELRVAELESGQNIKKSIKPHAA